MARINVVTPEKVEAVPLPKGLSGTGDCGRYLDAGRFPLQLHRHALQAGEAVTVGPLAADCVVYVWSGSLAAGGEALPAGSSAIVEAGGRLELTCTDPAKLLTFAACDPKADAAGKGAAHLLPAGRVPRSDDLGAGGVGGGMHADSAHPATAVWLHENHFPGAPEMSAEDKAKGVHSHSEDEIIFVTAGSMRLGNKLVGPGTALGIAADTLYSFTPGPDGLSFVNFRAGMPGDIQFASGHTISETGYWRERLPRPEYIDLPA